MHLYEWLQHARHYPFVGDTELFDNSGRRALQTAVLRDVDEFVRLLVFEEVEEGAARVVGLVEVSAALQQMARHSRRAGIGHGRYVQRCVAVVISDGGVGAYREEGFDEVAGRKTAYWIPN